MKSFSALALAFLASVVSAVPMAQTYDRIVVYKLKVAARSDIFLDGKYLGVRNSTIGIYDDAAEVQFYPMDSQQKGLVELHTYPIGIVDSVLGLVGSDGLLTFTNINNPAATSYPAGTDADWTSWELVEAGGDDSRADPRNKLTYAASRTGKWVAFPDQKDGEWKVTWLEGTAWVTQNYLPIEVIYERVTRQIIG